MSSEQQSQFTRWLDGDDESPWQSGFQIANIDSSDIQSPRPDRADKESRLFRLQQELRLERHVPEELMSMEDTTQQSEAMGRDGRVFPEARTLGIGAWETGDETRGSDPTENSASLDETGRDSLSSEEDGNASTILREDASTEVPSGSSERLQSQISGDDTESTRYDAKTRWAFLDEERRDENEGNAQDTSQDVESLALDTVQRPEVPPSIMEQIRIIASQYPDSLTEEQYQNFLKHPRETQRQSLRVFFDNLAGLGPWLQRRT